MKKLEKDTKLKKKSGKSVKIDIWKADESPILVQEIRKLAMTLSERLKIPFTSSHSPKDAYWKVKV